MACVLELDSFGLPSVSSKAAALQGCITDASLSLDQAVSTGTTIVGCVYKGGVILGADTRTSAGSYIVNRAARKISPICPNIFICRSGSAADTQAITQIAKYYVSNYIFENINCSNFPSRGASTYMPSVKVAATAVREVAYTYKDNLMAGMIIGGVNNDGSPQLFSIPIGGSCIEMQYTAGGSGSAFISAYLDSNYRENMSKEECIELVKKSVGYAISRDGSSGGMIRLLSIEKGNVEEMAVLGNNLPVDP